MDCLKEMRNIYVGCDGRVCPFVSVCDCIGVWAHLCV